MKTYSYVILIVIIEELFALNCYFDSKCMPSQYCEKGVFSFKGQCVNGTEENRPCFRDRTCASKQCHLFRCRKKMNIENGPCYKSADCPSHQYCDKVAERSELKQCMNRKCNGSCTKDSSCMSDNCRLWSCVKDAKKC